ncbi:MULTISPECIES: TRAP transporter large permease subunit [unclassified Deinococcus]|uniref:TRAP transporter large permease n=1 Tax=unclassified Deinococcus TaxID=2623546 RepID=UPI000C18F4AD|nr:MULTISPECIES: TRAP transporter large permease subunit [unclassified Deinococcus]MCD0158117.1 TRAP transporter large permease subunit [Deinococcus sp. 6GRE01]MCD0170545.1 TRAP transporter large permease subunit [Deinococcus sp. 23YEL01]PIG96337.1 C4-dicarboxylate ABC transporter [Deinococcus sp. UR1]
MDALGLWMFLGAFALIFTGYPVAFALAGTAIIFGLIGLATGQFDALLLRALPDRIFGNMSNFTLLAIPYFVFMGGILGKSGLAEDLLRTAGLLFGRLRGGIAVAVVLVGMLLAATTGVVAATVVTMGLISLPIMLKYGYDKALASGVIVASGTLGQIIPPSVVLVVLGSELGVSVGDLFLGSLVPGLMLGGLYIAYVLIRARLNPALAPAMPAEELNISRGALLKQVARAMVPPLILIFVVLGSIFYGVATATEAGAVGALGAVLLALANRRLTRAALWDVTLSTARLTGFVMFILIGSTAFALVFRALDGDLFMQNLLTTLPGGVIGFLILTNLVIFILGCFLDFFEIAFIVLPLFAPVARELGIDMIWFGILIGINLQTSFLTPPFGFSLFYLRGIAGRALATADIYRGVVPFIAIQLLVLALCMVFPGLTGLRAAGP